MILLLSTLFTSPAAACGGGWVFDLDAPLVPTERHLDDWLAGWDGYEVTPPPFTRFLYALHGEDPGVYAALEQSLYQAPLADEPAVTPITLDAFHAALRSGDRAAAHAAAAAVVEAVLDLPTALADASAGLLPAPVEYLELAPLLAKVPPATVAAYFLEGKVTGPVLAQAAAVRGLAPSAAAQVLAANPRHPRAASLRWLALRAALQRDIPNGWSRDEIATAMSPAVADQLIRDADSWLGDFPGHPLADYVRMARLRVQYLLGDGAGVWKNLLDLHTRHPARAVGEMRFVLLQGLTPPALDLVAMPPSLASALLPYTTLSGDTWSALWRSAEASPSAPWSLPLRERLLWQAAVGNPTELPDAFPTRAEAPSVAWGRLRLHALLRAGRFDEAWAQTEVLGSDAAHVAPIRAQIRLRRQDWVGALREPGLTPEGRTYLLRVLAPDDALRALVEDPDLGAQARLELALRARAAGDWRSAGALVAPAFPDRARLFAQAQKLDRKGQTLPLARFYRAQAGKIFLDNAYEDIVWYRSLPVSGPEQPPDRAPGLPFDPASEWPATSAWLQRSFATYAAFVAYARWLDALDVDRLDGAKLAEARAVLDEADRAYNLLLNYGSWDGYAWGRLLPTSTEAATVRRVGKALRERAP